MFVENYIFFFLLGFKGIEASTFHHHSLVFIVKYVHSECFHNLVNLFKSLLKKAFNSHNLHSDTKTRKLPEL